MLGLAGFYRDVLGLPELARHLDAAGELRSIWLDADGVMLMIERTDEPLRRVTGVGAGPFLLALEVAPEARAELEARLAGAGSPVESRSKYTSYTRDPEGNRVAISHYPLESA